MPSLRTQIVTASCSLALSAVAWSGERHVEKRFPAPPGTRLVVDADLGSITLRGTPSNEVSVTVDIRGRDRDVAQLDVTAEQTATGIEVRGRRARSAWSLFNWFAWSSPDVRFVISAPKSCVPRLHTSGGNIEVSDILGSVEAKTSGGDVRVRAVEGAVELTTSGGNVKTVDTKGALKLRTSGGNVSVSGALGRVDAGTSGGNVTIINASGHVRAGTSGGSVVVELHGANAGVHATTSGGDVTISVARSVRATIDAATSGGHVTCDLPGTSSGRPGRSHVQGDVNGGGPPIYARTSGGSVRIRALD